MSLLVATILLSATTAAEPTLERYQSTQRVMGVDFRIVLYAPRKELARRGFEAAFTRIKQLNDIFSDYDSASELSRLGQSAPHVSPVLVSEDMWTVLVHAAQLSQRTEGAFDITVGPLTKLWRRARRRDALPDMARINDVRERVGYQFMHLDRDARAVRLERAGMRLDAGALAKGYAADAALAELRKLGMPRASVDGGGDLALGQAPPGRCGWKIGIASMARGTTPQRFLRLSDVGIATSGDLWQFIEVDGVRYSHILDPRTGWGITRRTSVTIVARDCMCADALASALSVLGSQDGTKLLESIHHYGALIQVAEQESAAQALATGVFD